MTTFIFKMPDIGEGIVEAEIVEWHVQPGDDVAEDALLTAVMTDKATVDITSPVAGRISTLGGAVGEKIAIGADLVIFATEGDGNSEAVDAPAEAPLIQPSRTAVQSDDAGSTARAQTPVATMTDTVAVQKKLASPAVRRRASELGIDLAEISGSGPKGRILLDDLNHRHANPSPDNASIPSPKVPAATPKATDKHPVLPVEQEVTDIPVTGLRRIIARRMQAAKQTIPHFTYVEEVDVTELEILREHLNQQRDANQPKLSPLHFMIVGVCRAVAGWPQCNAHYDSDAEVLSQFSRVHAGVATMTDAGLMVPVIRNAHSLSLWNIASEVNRLALGAREQSLSRDELSGSTITISSLGPLAGIAATPILNAPETCIIGPNKIRPQLALRNGSVVSRQVLNLSSSFDHRVVDGFDAAGLIQRLKQLLEHPATLFIDQAD